MNKIYLIVSICFFAVIFASCGESSSTEEKPGSQQNSSLIWSVKSSNKLNWQEAKDYCQNLTEREQSDWHLPTIEELRNLIQSCPGTVKGGSCNVSETCAGGYCLDESCQACSPETDGSYSKLGDTNQLWSATSVSNYDPSAWYVDFSNAGIYQDGKENYRYARCTRIVKGTERERDCQELPDKAKWNTDSGIRNEDGDPAITQTWNGSDWLPSTTASYNEETSATECRFKCVENYEWDGGACVNAKRNAECTGLPENAEWNTVSSITQTWNDEDWVPETAGSYNTNPSSTECRFKCNTNYSWKNSRCAADTRTADCTGLPANAVWNSASSITQTWNGSDWIPANSGTYDTNPSSSECRFKCDQNYDWNSSTSKCVPATRQAECSSKPENTDWNDNGANGKFIQTWNGSEWNPANYTSTYNTTAGICRYKCADGYHTENSGASCISNTKTGVACTGLPTNASWNTVSSITQTWNGSSWTPTTTGSFNSTASTSECRFKCNTNYNWNSSSKTCDAAKQTVNCTAKPANTVWNTVSTVTQTWTGSAWSPSNTSTYNTTASTTECRYKCASGYHWWGIETGCTDKLTIGNICTGQTSCYNASESPITCPSSSSADFFGQDAQYTSKCTAQSFTVQKISSKEVVLDNNTGLMWQQTIFMYISWDDAVSYCNDLSYAGYSDWRLPSPQELLTIVDNSQRTPAINTTYFPDTPWSSDFWSSSTDQSDTDYAWYVDFDDGYVGLVSKTDTSHVRCVRGATLPTGSFESSTVNSDVIVTDTETGLIWQKTYVTDKSWQQALKYCEESDYAGFTDWRLPNKNELASLVNYEKYNPASDFPDMPSEAFWSSSSLSDFTNGAWGVSFALGKVYSPNKSSSYLVRCVRSE